MDSGRRRSARQHKDGDTQSTAGNFLRVSGHRQKRFGRRNVQQYRQGTHQR